MKKDVIQKQWDEEYQNPQFTSFDRAPHQAVKDFLSYLRRKQKWDLDGKVLFDIGCGIGKDVSYAIDHYGMKGIGCDVSLVAIREAKKHSPDGNYFVHDLSEKIPLNLDSADCVLLVMVFHTLDKKSRELCLHEIYRILKPGGFCFLKTLVLEGDAHAKYLIANMPGNEPNSFIHPDLHVSEYVYKTEELKSELSSLFEIVSFEKTEGYQRWGNQKYKRKYAVAYLQKK